MVKGFYLVITIFLSVHAPPPYVVKKQCFALSVHAPTLYYVERQ